jgi:protein-disulfide isomerase
MLSIYISFGVMKTPTLVIDDQVKVVGRVMGVEEIKKYLK